MSKKFNFKTVAVAVTALGTAATLSTTAFAGTSATVTGATSVTMTSPTIGDFNAVTLNGANQTTTASIGNFTVTDATGTGNGWKVIVQATPFSDGTHTLANNSVNLTAPQLSDISETNGGTTAGITPTGGYIDDASSAGIALLTAGTGAGMGNFNVTMPADNLTLSVPAWAYKGTYTSTITVSISQGPTA